MDHSGKARDDPKAIKPQQKGRRETASLPAFLVFASSEKKRFATLALCRLAALPSCRLAVLPL
jgi:hypothetical protein